MRERTLLDYWLILARRRAVIYVVMATAMGAALVVGRTMAPVYEARAAFYVPTDLPAVSYLSGQVSTLARKANTPIQDEDAYKPYIGILKSAQLAERVHAQYPKKEISKLLRSDVDFETTDEYIVRVYSRDPDPVLAANVANAYVDGLNQILAASSQAQVAREPDYIQKAMSGVQGELDEAEAALKRFEERHHIASLDTELSKLTGQKSDLQDKLQETAVSRMASRGKQKALLDEFEREGQGFAASEVATTSPLIEHLRVQLADLLAKQAELEAELGRNNVETIALRKRAQQTEQQLSGEIRRWLAARIKPQSSHLEALRQQLIEVVIELQRLEAVERGYTQSARRVEARLGQYPEIKARWTDLNDAVTRLRTSQQQLRLGLAEAQLQTDRQMQLVVPLDRADAPKRPAFPVWWLNALVAMLAGTLAGIGYAFFLNYLEETRQVRLGRLVRAILGAQRPRVDGGQRT